jgi:putative membrane protein
MKTNKTIIRVLTIVMVLTLLSSSIVTAEGRVSKEETVYANLNNKGEELDKTSSIWLHSDGSLNNIEDESILKEVTNVKGEEKPTVENGKLIWKTDKKDIYYQGKVGKELPIQPEIKYYLDGKEVNPEDIVGEDGEIKVTINILNEDKRSIHYKNGGAKEIYAPYMVATVVDLPMDKFTNVKISTGKIIADGSNQIITFVSLPGFKDSLGVGENLVDLTDYLEIKADVKNFEMKPIAFTVTSEIPEIDGLDDAKDLDELIDGIDKIKEASEKLSESTQKLYDGQMGLSSGIDEFVNGMGALKVGSNSLLDGSLKLKEGINGAYEGSLKANEGANTLSQSANQLGEGFVGLGNGTVEFSDKAAEFSEGAKKAAEGIGSIPESTQALSGGMEELIQGTETLKNGQDKLTQGLGKSVEALEQIKAGKEKEGKTVGLLLKGVDGLETIANTVGKIPGADGLAAKMLEGLEGQRLALEGIESSSDELILALNQVEEGLKESEEASKELSQGIENVNNGQKKTGGGLNELAEGTKGLKEASNQLVEGSTGLQQGANSLNENALKAKEGAGKFSQGSKGLAEGTKGLSTGLGELNTGAGKLYGGINELSKGTNELAQGGEKLKDGSHQLTEGTKKLNEGMNEFHEEGIKKISDKVDNSNLDITKILETKDELVKISKENVTFSGKSEDMDGNLKFIMKTEGAKEEEKQEELDVKAESKKEKGFIAWLKGIIKK